MNQREAFEAWYDKQTVFTDDVELCFMAWQAAQAAQTVEPACWGMLSNDGDCIWDVICNEEHARHEGKYTVPLYRTPPAHAEAISFALEALDELTEAGAEAWGESRPCVREGRAAIAALKKIGGM
jgi:hypothetical protein